jgi:hypothetical protein
MPVLLKNVLNTFAHRCYFIWIAQQLFWLNKKIRRKNFPAVQDQMFWLWNVCEQMVMHVKDKSVSSCSLVYSGMHLGQLDKSHLFFIVLRSKLPRSRHQKCTDLERAAVCWIPKRGIFLNLDWCLNCDYYSISFESMLIMKWVYRRISWVIIAVQLFIVNWMPINSLC